MLLIIAHPLRPLQTDSSVYIFVCIRYWLTNSVNRLLCVLESVLAFPSVRLRMNRLKQSGIWDQGGIGGRWGLYSLTSWSSEFLIWFLMNFPMDLGLAGLSSWLFCFDGWLWWISRTIFSADGAKFGASCILLSSKSTSPASASMLSLELVLNAPRAILRHVVRIESILLNWLLGANWYKVDP